MVNHSPRQIESSNSVKLELLGLSGLARYIIKKQQWFPS